MTEPVHAPLRLLVTGGAGFIGSGFVHWLLARDAGCSVVVADKLTYAGDRANLAGADPGRCRLEVVDICDGARMAALIGDEGIDTVVHLAAESHVDRSIDGPAAFIHTNLVGTYTLIEAARTVWIQGGRAAAAAKAGSTMRFHHVSTDEVYGDLGPCDAPFREDTPYQPSSPYSASKAGSDHLVRAWARTYALPVTLSNCSNNYGPRQHGEKLLPTVIRHCLNRTPIPVYGRGENVRDWLFVDDHAAAIWHIVRHGVNGETYNIGGDNEWTNLALVGRICDAVAAEIGADPAELRGLVQFVSDRPGHDRRYAIDAARLRALGWTAPTPFADGLAQTVRWYVSRAAGAGLGDHRRIGLGAA